MGCDEMELVLADGADSDGERDWGYAVSRSLHPPIYLFSIRPFVILQILVFCCGTSGRIILQHHAHAAAILAPPLVMLGLAS